LAIRIIIANSAHSSVSGLLFTTYSCWQWRYEQIWKLFPNGTVNFFYPKYCFFPVGKVAMNALQYWELCNDACNAVETSANTPRFSYPYCVMNFHGRVGN
jgi:hypothetical protein